MAKGTDKGMARKGKMAGSRLAFDDTKQAKMKTTKKRTLPKSLMQYQEAVRHAKKETGHTGMVKKGSKCYAMAKKLHAEMMKK
tara:strand:- start:127 stop:375 length:249 start_codon:yes stop_codon:yes gene_type:complete